MEIKANYQLLVEDVKKLAKELRIGIEDGLDHQLDEDVDELKSTLKGLINEGITTTVDKDDPKSSASDTLSGMPRSDAEIIKYFTGLDVSKYMKSKDVTQLVDSGVSFVYDRNKLLQNNMNPSFSRMSSGVNLRLNMSDFDTFEAQLQKAQDYFNNSMFVMEINGEIRYFMNPGIDMTPYVKVVCSNQVGDTARSRNRFDRLRDGSSRQNNKGSYADWTLLADGLQVVQKQFIDITDVVQNIKQGDFQAASDLIKSKDLGRVKTEEVSDKVENLKDGKLPDSTSAAYINIISMINNLKIKKTISEYKTTYTLFTDFNEGLEEDTEKFFDTLKEQIYVWKIDNEEVWIKAVIEAINKVVEKYNK
jgi:hypothetical protein